MWKFVAIQTLDQDRRQKISQKKSKKSKQLDAENKLFFSLNPVLSELKVSATFATNTISQKLEQENKKVYKFGLGQSPFPVPLSVVNALKLNAAEKRYLPVEGLDELREALAMYILRKTGEKYDKAGIIIGSGTKELMFILQFVINAELILPSPSWASYQPQAKLVKKKTHIIPCKEAEDWKITASTLDLKLSQLKVKNPESSFFMILTYPNNPTGINYTETELEQLAGVLRKHKLLVLADEIYGDLAFDGQYQSISKYYREGTIISTGLSKWCAAGGWRLGGFIFPENLDYIRAAMIKVGSETYSCATAPVQKAAIVAFKGGKSIKTYLSHCRNILQFIAKWIHAKLQDAQVRVRMPTGGFYLFLNFEAYIPYLKKRGIETPNQFTQELLQETGIALIAGNEFCRPADEYTARLAYINFDGQNALEAVEKGQTLDQTFLANYASNVKAGIEVLCEWLLQLKRTKN